MADEKKILIVDGISERIAKKVSEDLQREITELWEPIYQRLNNSKDRIYYINVDGKKTNILNVIKKIQIVIYDQEIKDRTNQALSKFIRDVGTDDLNVRQGEDVKPSEKSE
jgi:hypothetical protein